MCLKYLSFKRCFLEQVPKSISKLPELQILDLRVASSETWVTTLSNVLWKMKGLIQLYLPRRFRVQNNKKLRLEGLTKLEILKNFDTSLCCIDDLNALPNLRYISIYSGVILHQELKKIVDFLKKTHVFELSSSIHIKSIRCYTQELQSLCTDLFNCHTLHFLNLEGHIGHLPQSKDISSRLTKLVLAGSELKEDPMPILGALGNLAVLVLLDDAYIGKEIVCSAKMFPELKYLKLLNLKKVEKWVVEEGGMPRMIYLEVKQCSLLEIPQEVRLFKHLQIVEHGNHA